MIKKKKQEKLLLISLQHGVDLGKMIAPTFVEWSNTYDKIKFLKVDVDDQTEVSEAEKIEAMPTFKFFGKWRRKNKNCWCKQKKN
eukprot:EC820263.1.p1 GENE.EC820263.1~~EC820263.1.p1  ORF type:complete len:85 (-),score=27.15 EC820263.1:114-368(-)